MGKLTWKHLELIYEGQYGVTADEASDWIAKELFSKNWFGTPQKLGRMWEDIEICIAFTTLLSAIDKFKEENNYKDVVAIKVMHENKHPAIKAFGADARHGFFGMSSSRFANLVGQWRIQLTDMGFLKKKPKPISENMKKYWKEVNARQERKLKKQGLVKSKRIKS
jgi:hypothetical protein|tara:strand:+ start:1752 stop:2249 length:498 start_codon:yes stop_codon:yes gene_type:complete